MTSMFLGPKLKIKRADHHIEQLNSALVAFCKTDFCRLSIEIDAKEGTNRLVFERTKEIPEEIPLILGDAAHNLRAALDLLACDIVRLAGEEASKFTKFPFRKTRDDLVAALNGGELKAARADIADLIVDSIQPYPGGKNAALHVLHELDIQDKHLLITPVLAVAMLIGVDFEDANRNRFVDATLTVGEGGKLRALATSAPLKITRQGRPAFDVLFAKGQPFEGQPVIPTLQQLSKLVSTVIHTVEKAYDGAA